MDAIKVNGKVLVDSFGRERIFNGINICDKGVYDESIKKRTYSHQWSEEEFDKIAASGFNLIRLGITWDAVEHVKGKYDDEYLDAVKKMLDMCYAKGIYAFIDMHQDLYTGWEGGPGDGAPTWAFHTDKYKYKNPKLVWAESYFISKATHRAFDNFWDDKYADQEAFRKMWKHVAEKLDGHPALFGYDYFNEPFLGKDGGKVFRVLIGSVILTTIKDKRLSIPKMIKNVLSGNAIKVLDMYTGEIFHAIVNKAAPIVNKFDETRYMPFLNKITKELRTVSKNPIVFMENSYYSNLGIKFAGTPITVDGVKEPNQVFSPHGYDLMVDTPAYKAASDERLKSIFGRRKYEQDTNLNIPVIVGEWGGSSEGTEWLHHIEYILDLFDEYKWSNTYWAFFRGLLDMPLGEVLKRPYPRAVTGEIISYKHDRDANMFTLKYSQDKDFDAPTEIFAHKKIESVETDGEYTIEQTYGGYIIKINTGKGEHCVNVKFEGEGFSYMSEYLASK